MSKQIPILYSTEMVRAKKAGRKTITRRMRGLDVINENPDNWELCWVGHTVINAAFENQFGAMFQNKETQQVSFIKCPYGQPGDILWTRESWNRLITGGYRYRADDEWNDLRLKWKPNIHMPKAACRMWDEVVSIRCERLHDITPSDACDEGIEYWNIDHDALEGGELQADFKNYTWRDDENYKDYHFPTFSNSVDSFRSLWELINGEKSWNHNPWVWCIKFREIEKPVDV